MYRPPSSNIATFLDEFAALIEDLNVPSRDLVIMGDFNIHVNDLTDSRGARFLDLLNDLSLRNNVNVPTYKHSLHTLDLVIDSYVDRPVSNVEVCALSSFSDHSLVTFDVNCVPFYAKVDTPIEFRLYNNIESFEQEVRANLDVITPWASDSLTQRLNHVVSFQKEQFFPLVSKIITISASSPWFNSACKSAKTKCRRFERKCKRCPSEITKSRYLTALKEYNDTLRAAKSDYYSSLFDKLRNNPRRLYATVSIIKGKANEKILPDLSRTNPLQLANKFNDFLFQKISAIRLELDSVPSTAVNFTPFPVNSPLSEFRPISLDEFEAVYKRCNTTHCQLDPIDFRKISPQFLKNDFLNIINTTFESRVFPTSEKRGIIYPLLKAHDLDIELLSNYRPITNVSYLSKLIETAIYTQLYEHISVNDILPVRQSAYRQHHSTESALTSLHSDIITNIDGNLHTLLISLDLSAAFDSVDHNLLLNELSSIGVTGAALETIQSYLTDRRVQVAVGDSVSDILPLKFGVPQGSVLGPLLFSLYTRRLSILLSDLGLSHHIYADDTQIYCSFRENETETVKAKVISALQSVKSWMTSMKLRLNCSKTKLILFSPRHTRAAMKSQFGHLSLDGTDIHLSSEVKILGVTFDSDLTFESQISNLVKTCNFALHGIRVARDFLPHDILVSTVTHEVLSRLDYCNSLYLKLPKYQLHRLQKVMNRAVRLIYRLPRNAHITPHLKRLHWLPIGQRIDYKVILLTHKALRHGQPSYLTELLGHSNRRGHLPHSTAIGGHALSERSFRYAAPRLFNAIPLHVSSLTCTDTFKRNLKTVMFDYAFDYKLDSLLSYVPSSDFVMRRA